MHHEGQVRLVEAHAQSGGGHQCPDPVGLELFLQALALSGVGLPRVGGHLHTGCAQVLGDLHRRRDRQAVDDAAAGSATDVGGQPGQAGGGIRQHPDPQVERATLQGPPQHQDLPTARPGFLQGRPQLLSDIGADPGVGSRRRRQDRGVRRQAGQQGADAPVVRAEVVSPVRDAVGLVDDDKRGARSQVGQNLIAEDRVVEALRGDQQNIDLTSAHLVLNLIPLGDIG